MKILIDRRNFLKPKNYFRNFCEIEDNQFKWRGTWSQTGQNGFRKWVENTKVSILRRSKSIVTYLYYVIGMYLVFFYAHFFFHLKYIFENDRILFGWGYLWQKNKNELKYCSENNKSMNRGKVIEVMKDQENCHDIDVLQFAHTK